MPHKTKRVWLWGSEENPAILKCSAKIGLSVMATCKFDRSINLKLGETSHLESAQLTYEIWGDITNYYELLIEGVQVAHDWTNEDRKSFNDTKDITGYVQEGRNYIELILGSAFKYALIPQTVTYEVRVYVDITAFVSEEDEEKNGFDVVYPDENGARGCLMMAMVGGTFLAPHLFPYLRLFRDLVLPRFITEGYYQFSTWILRLVHLL